MVFKNSILLYHWHLHSVYCMFSNCKCERKKVCHRGKQSHVIWLLLVRPTWKYLRSLGPDSPTLRSVLLFIISTVPICFQTIIFFLVHILLSCLKKNIYIYTHIYLSLLLYSEMEDKCFVFWDGQATLGTLLTIVGCWTLRSYFRSQVLDEKERVLLPLWAAVF